MKFSSDWPTRVGQINAYVATQYAAMDTAELTMGQVMEHLQEKLFAMTDYQPKLEDYPVLRKAVMRIMAGTALG